MKKLGILVMAMVLVCGMSFGVLALEANPTDESRADGMQSSGPEFLGNDLGETSDENTEDQEIPIKLGIDRIALLNIPEDATFDLGILNAIGNSPDDTGGANNESDEVTASILANCPVKVTVANNLEANELGLEEWHLDQGDGSSDWVISPNVNVWGYPDSGNGIMTFAGEDSFTIDEAPVNTEMKMKYNLNINQDDPRWVNMEPIDEDTNVGNVLITIEATN